MLQLAIVVAASLAAGLMAWSLAGTFGQRHDTLAKVLAPYSGEPGAALDDPSGFKLTRSALVRRAVDSATRAKVTKRLVEALELRLAQANVPLHAGEGLVVYGAGAALVAVLVFMGAGPMLALFVASALLLLPFPVLSFIAGRRRARFNAQLPDALKLLSGTLRAGYSLVQGLDAMAAEVGNPMGEELSRALVEARLGRPVDEALSDMASRLGSADFEWTVMAITIQRQVGGNLSELLDTVAETMLARQRLRREVRSLTAEGRMSAIVISILPPALGMVMWVMNREYISLLFTDPVGKMLAIAATVLAVFGFWWMRKTVQIDI
jgi:tight adherence protein B